MLKHQQQEQIPKAKSAKAQMNEILHHYSDDGSRNYKMIKIDEVVIPENLSKKRSLIDRLKTLSEQPIDENTEKEVRNAIKEWNETGHVPFKEKDKVYKEFHKLVDLLFDSLNLSATQRKLSNFKSNIKDLSGKETGNLLRERERLIRQYEAKKNEIQTYENNLGFLTTSSKKGNNLVNEINRKVDRLKAELKLLEEQINLLDSSMDE